MTELNSRAVLPIDSLESAAYADIPLISDAEEGCSEAEGPLELPIFPRGY